MEPTAPATEGLTHHQPEMSGVRPAVGLERGGDRCAGPGDGRTRRAVRGACLDHVGQFSRSGLRRRSGDQPAGKAVVAQALIGDEHGNRHRHVNHEPSWSAAKPKHVRHRGYVRGWRHGVYRDGPYVAAYGDGGGKAAEAEMQTAMGIDWTDIREELTEAVPPAYSEWLGCAFLTRTAGAAA